MYRAVYAAHQEAIHKAGQCREYINKGISSGKNIYDLFLKAIECISLMTGEPLFYSHNREQIKAIYGAGIQSDIKEHEERTAIQVGNMDDYEKRIRKCFAQAYKFFCENKNARTEEDWERIAKKLPLYTDPFTAELLVACIEEFERESQ